MDEVPGDARLRAAVLLLERAPPITSTPDQPAARGVRIGGKAEEGEEGTMLAAVARLCIIGWLVDILIEKKH